MRRLKSFQITPQAIISLITSKKYTRCTNDVIPEDAVFHSCYYEHQYLSFFIIVEHPSFPKTPEGSLIERTLIGLEMEHASLNELEAECSNTVIQEGV